MSVKAEQNTSVLLMNNKGKWQSMKVRALTGFSLMGVFFLGIYLGHFTILAMITLTQFLAFYELMKIPSLKMVLSDRERQALSIFNWIPWVYLTIAMYVTNAGALLNIFSNQMYIPELPYAHLVWDLVRYHKLVTFGLYSVAVVLFVLTLEKGYYTYQYRRWAIVVLGIFTLVVQSHVMIYNLFQGIFWFFFPLSLIIVNDTSAYFWGFFFGSHSLIQLSPKKTWEGFIGALFTTIAWAWFVAPLFGHYPYFICPATTSNEMFGWLAWESHEACTPQDQLFSSPFGSSNHVLANALWKPTDYALPGLLSIFGSTITLYPIQFHAIILAIVASTIAPFGGFFASGLKRAYSIKDFGSLLPGHGGFIDRVDCQFIMALFVYIYIDTVLLKNVGSGLSRVWSQVENLSISDQFELRNHLNYILETQSSDE